MNQELEILLTYNLEVMQCVEDDELNQWYILDHSTDEVLNNEWFRTEKQAQDYLDSFIKGE